MGRGRAREVNFSSRSSELGDREDVAWRGGVACAEKDMYACAPRDSPSRKAPSSFSFLCDIWRMCRAISCVMSWVTLTASIALSTARIGTTTSSACTRSGTRLSSPPRHAAPPRPRTLSKLWWHHAILEMMSHARPAPVVATEAPRQPHGATREGVRHGRRAWRRRARHRVMIAGRWRRRRLPRRRRQLLSEP